MTYRQQIAKLTRERDALLAAVKTAACMCSACRGTGTQYGSLDRETPCSQCLYLREAIAEVLNVEVEL